MGSFQAFPPSRSSACSANYRRARLMSPPVPGSLVGCLFWKSHSVLVRDSGGPCLFRTVSTSDRASVNRPDVQRVANDQSESGRILEYISWEQFCTLWSQALWWAARLGPVFGSQCVCRLIPKLRHHTYHPIHLLLSKPPGLLARLGPIRLGSGFYLPRFWVCSD